MDASILIIHNLSAYICSELIQKRDELNLEMAAFRRELLSQAAVQAPLVNRVRVVQAD